jgi:hypothetical protein
MDIIILSSIVTILFVTFLFLTFKEFTKEHSEPVGIENSPRAKMIRFVGRMFDEQNYNNAPVEVKKYIYTKIERTISDMESDGVYFPEEVKKELEKKREQLTCEYSGLPSVMSYDNGTLDKYEELTKGLH